MKIQYCSDLHLEFQQNNNYLKANPLKPVGDILVLAGDVVPFAIMNKHAAFFKYVSDNFESAYWIPGNHEYYHFDAVKKSGVINEKIRSNVFLVNNIAIEQDNIKFIFSTLWTKINPANEWHIERSMSDFQVIRYNGYRFSSTVYNQLHENCIRFIKDEIAQVYAGKTIVATHHAPTLMHYPEKYKGDMLNEAFAVELFPLIENSGIDYWVYGHHHNNTTDFIIGKTCMLTNQLGYVQNGEHMLFDNAKTISI